MKRLGTLKWIWIGGVCAVIVLSLYSRSRRPDAMESLTSIANRRLAVSALAVKAVVGRPSIAGIVTDSSSKPIAGAHVCAVPSSVAPASTEGICADADLRGHYAIERLPLGSYLVTAAQAGFVTTSAQQGQAIEVLGDTAGRDVDIVLQPGGAKVTGVVVDATGGPVPHAIIRGERVVAPRAAIDIEADDLGSFTLWFPSGLMFLAAQAEGYAPARWSGPAPAVNIRLELTPGATVRGIVISSKTGEPVPNIEVRAVSTRNAASLWFQSSTTGADGSFEVSGIEPGSYTLLAAGDSWHGELAQPIELGLGSRVERVRIEVSAAMQVSGRVVVANTQLPCEQGLVSLNPLDPKAAPPEPDQPPVRMRGGPSFIANIRSNGIVHFPAVSSGHYSVHVDCLYNLFRDGPRTLDVGANALSDLTWTVSPGLSLTVLTVDNRDRPIPGVLVYLRFPRGPIRPGTTDDAGRYDFSGMLSAGSYEISAQPPFEAEHVRVELHDGDSPVTAKLKIAGTASIVATVRERGGSPVDGLLVRAIAQSYPSPEVEASPPAGLLSGVKAFMGTALGDGRYRIAPLEPGRYEIRADDGTNATARATYELAEGDALQATMEIERAGQIHGHVVDDNGAPVPDVWVSAVAHDSDRMLRPRGVLGNGARVLTDPRGRFVLDRLAGGDASYIVRVDQPSGGAAVKDGVRVGDADVIIALRAAGTLTGLVEGDCGDTETPIKLQAMSLATGQTTVQELTAPGKPFRVSLAPGQVQLLAVCRDGRGVAQLTTQLAPKEQLAGLRLVLQPASVQATP